MLAEINLYSVQQSRDMDQLVINEYGIPAYELMQRAALACFNIGLRLWPDASNVIVLCGTGNNGGDGYLIAKRCLQHGLNVSVIQLGDIERQKGAALMARQALRKAGLTPMLYSPSAAIEQKISSADIVYDALLGTGLEREIAAPWKEMILTLNRQAVPVIAVDIPSGLHADTGIPLGASITAHATVCLLSRKKGLYTGYAPQACGQIFFDDLGVSHKVYSMFTSHTQLLRASCIQKIYQQRTKVAHKGVYGHALLIGGDVGMAGSIHLAAQAALRSGAGLVSVITTKNHAVATSQAQPELMCHAFPEAANYQELETKASAIAIGPGLGFARWGQMLFQKALESKKIKIVDASALTWLAQNVCKNDSWILTPHPGEAATLLGVTIAQIEADRFAAATAIQIKYGGVCLLKGAGSIITDGHINYVCPFGNPGMASGGMGDTLTGILVAVAAQAKSKELSLVDIAAIGVTVHSLAADYAAKEGEHGMLASDVIQQIRRVINTRG